MARPRNFDEGVALDAAIGVFREHGFEGTSAEMLVEAMGIGRQSLYNAFGDKWQLYCAAVARYGDSEAKAHREALASGNRAIDGIRRMLDRVVENANDACLGVGSICEFGRSRPDLAAIHDRSGIRLGAGIAQAVRRAQAERDVAPDADPEAVSAFLTGTIASLRIAARSGGERKILEQMRDLALRALH